MVLIGRALKCSMVQFRSRQVNRANAERREAVETKARLVQMEVGKKGFLTELMKNRNSKFEVGTCFPFSDPV